MPRLPIAAVTAALLLLACASCGSSDGALAQAPATSTSLAPATTAARNTTPAPVPTSSTTTTIGEFATSPNRIMVSNVTLRSDGLGSFRFGAPADQVRFGLASDLGPTTEPDDILSVDRTDCDPTPATILHWGAFQVALVGDPGAATFVGYDLIGPPVNPGLATSNGLTVGQSYDQAAAILGFRPPVQPSGGGYTLGALPPGSPVVEISGRESTDPISRLTAGDLPTCDLPPDQGNYEPDQ